MEYIFHILGLCPDNQTHISLFKALVVGMNDIYYALVYLKCLIK